ncbi:MAG: NAD(P)H-hydrate epimerase, partial [Vicinamibacterales bacterium]|nr:NAD(P)H-hydrate epimerase [Vicinamibacterales bacterium]
MRVLNTEQMREADRRTTEEIGLPSVVLMENAGRQVVAALEAHFDDLATQRVAVLCGRGNNGGDGFVIARTLKQRDIEAAVFVFGPLAGVQGDARRNLDILGQVGMTVVEIPDEQAWELHYSEIAAFDVIVDAILGTGIRVPLVGLMQTLVADVNGLDIPVVSVDLPTGLSADSHDVVGEAIEAILTVTMGAPKLPLVLPPAEAHAGDLVVADVGIPGPVIDALEGPRLELITREGVRDMVAARPAESHKGDFGRVLVVAGSVGKSGAAGLAATGALKSGAGLVTVATPRSCQAVVAGYAADYMTVGLEDTPEGCVDLLALDQVLELTADVIAAGPGLGQGPSVVAFVHGLLERSGAPLVLDADAL